MLGNKQVMAKNISRLMKENNIDRKKLSNDLKVKYTTLSDWINAKTYPRIDKIELLADYFNVTKADLVEDKEKQVLETLPVKKIPVVSKISAGLPIYSEENLIDYIYFATNKLNSDKEEFGLKVSGDSMDKIFQDGDIVVVEKDSIVENGQLGVVMINGYNATVKRIRYNGDQVILIPESNNTNHYPQVYGKNDEVKIIGRVVASQKLF
ncbi:helix-turn-helix domain-containing protein [Staphylococcus epidermidis]|jgi:repressor LexA|uniref:helix-turn-helix domain-containing protein n=1 Tax=Staphylococcus epidermidis TaxID=1282 RepID=UPI0008EAF8D8|nr:XRE family transcriptional regulator [Staphylococcus epidermidis]MDU6126196.1 XRE family transcriptional regulator [Veillonella sp.]MBC8789269.1 helix-turn-helix domain-containing protein [Staphylococcus epidermidis]MBM0797622.1 XRE family transcriptional regulator [Staphylococcus epidermidis]MBM0838449.1 XRE family transcriptional regulator [Staphylococcus epidermidis]MBM0872873.1 XRE family transcriptional regulator [Staphylococcus epidermidis]